MSWENRAFRFFLVALALLCLSADGQKKGRYPIRLPGCQVPYPCDVTDDTCANVHEQPADPDAYIERAPDREGGPRLTAEEYDQREKARAELRKLPIRYNHAMLFASCLKVYGDDPCYNHTVFSSLEECKKTCSCIFPPDTERRDLIWRAEGSK